MSILIVDDTASQRLLLTSVLKSAAYRAKNASKALCSAAIIVVEDTGYCI